MNKQSIILSWVAIAFSITACIITFLDLDKAQITNDSFIGIISSFMGIIATILVGVQIFNSIETRNSINKLNDSVETRVKEVESNYHKRLREIQTLNNKLQYEITELNKKIEESKNERTQNENIMQAYIARAHGVSLIDIQPFSASIALYHGLQKALENNDAEVTESILHDMEVIVNRMRKKASKNINKAHANQLEIISPNTLENFQLYPIIKIRYTNLFNSLQQIKQLINESENE